MNAAIEALCVDFVAQLNVVIEELAVNLAQDQINDALAQIAGKNVDAPAKRPEKIAQRRPRSKVKSKTKVVKVKARVKTTKAKPARKRKPTRAAARKAVVEMGKKLTASARKKTPVAAERPAAPARTRSKPKAERFPANVVDMAKAKAEIAAEAKAEAKREAQASKPTKASDRTEARLAKMPPEKADALRKIAVERKISLATVVDHPSRYLKVQIKPLGTVTAAE